MDPVTVIADIGDRAGHCHGKDVQFAAQNLARNGLLDHRWPKGPKTLGWNFAVVGRGHAPSWWREFVGAIRRHTRVRTIAIEHEDPFAGPEEGVVEAARVLSGGAG